MTWTDTKAEIFSEGTTCQVYRKELERECGAEAVDLDHAIYPGMQRNPRRQTKAWRDFLDSPHNAQRACADCNRWFRTADRPEATEHHIKRQISVYGERFLEWNNNPPEGMSDRPGSKRQEITRIVERCINE